MYSCKDSVRVLGCREGKSWWQQFNVFLHLLICVHCRKYFRQIRILKSAFQSYFRKNYQQNIFPGEIEKLEKKIFEDLDKS